MTAHPETPSSSEEATPSPAVEAEELVARIQKRVAEINEHVDRYPSQRESTTWQHAEDLKALLGHLTRLASEKARLEAQDARSLAEINLWAERQREVGELYAAERSRADKAEADLSALKQRVAEVIEPFANLKGRFPETVLVEICHPCPDNPSPRIEPFLVRHIERAAELHASLTQEVKS